jgi:hypothetical protein
VITNPTQHKAKEAEFHLRKAKEHYRCDDTFAFYLSAFLSASRSVTFYMQKQYGKLEGFPEWYCAEQTRMRADNDLKYLNEARIEDVHRKPIHTGAARSVSVRLDAILGKEGGERIDEPNPVVTNKYDASEPSTLMRYFAGRKQIEIIEFCSTQFSKIVELVAKCEALFPNKANPAPVQPQL